MVVLADRHLRRTEHRFMHLWRGALDKVGRLKRLAEILQQENTARLQHKFIPTLAQNNYRDQVGTFLLHKRYQTMQAEFLN